MATLLTFAIQILHTIKANERRSVIRNLGIDN